MPRNGGKRNRVGESKHSPRRILAANKHLRVIELLLEGKSRKQVAAALGYCPSGVTRAAEAALKRTLQEPCDRLRNIRVAKLEVAEAAIWPDVEAGDLEAIDRFIKIDKRISELQGLDAPTKLEHSGEVKDGHDHEEIKDLLRDPEFRAFASRRLARKGRAKS